MFKIRVGTLSLVEPRDVGIPQEVAAWHQTVRVEPGVYDVHAYVHPFEGGRYAVHAIASRVEGVTVSSSFRSRIGAHYGKGDNNRNGERAAATIEIPRFGVVGESYALLDQVTLGHLLIRYEWDPRQNDAKYQGGRMWRFEVRPDVRIVANPGQSWGLHTFEAHVVADRAEG